MQKELPKLDSLMNIYSGISALYYRMKTIRNQNSNVVTNILKLSHPILLDKYGMVFKKYSHNQALPTLVLINELDEIIYSKDGYDTNTINEINDVINKNFNIKTLYDVKIKFNFLFQLFLLFLFRSRTNIY